MLFGPDSVREVLAEVLQHVQPGTLVIDATTVNLASLATDGRGAGGSS